MNPSTAYLAQQLAAASPAKRIAMLHDRAIGVLHEAIAAIGQGDIQRRWTANNKAGEIIETLWRTLDTERGGEIAANLERLYGFMLQHLTTVDMRNDPKPAKDVIQLLEPLRQSWYELVGREEAGGRAPEAAATADERPPGAGSAEPRANKVAMSA